jgi:transcriptional regulator with XRE-family HTH domain
MMSDTPPGAPRRFAGWLEASMRSRGLTQAQLARSVGVADTQVSRWRRGQVVPTLQYLQRLADTFGVERVTLDELVGLPIAQTRSTTDPEQEAELQTYQARFRDVLETKLPRAMWRSYLEACVALADGLSSSARRVVRQSLEELERSTPDDPPPDRPLGFHP